MINKKTVWMLSALLFLLSACSNYQIKEEAPARPDLSKYKTVFVGWIDMGSSNWKEMGYNNESDWARQIREINVDVFLPAVKQALGNKNLVLAKTLNERPAGDLAVVFSKTSIERRWNGFSGGYDYIHTTVDFIDLRNKKNVYKGSIWSSSKGWGPQGWRFEGRLGFATVNIADYIASKF